jgi:hypothetical protein
MEGGSMQYYAAVVTGVVAIFTFIGAKLLERESVTKALLAEIQRLLVVLDEHHGHWVEWMTKGETPKHPLIPFSCDVYSKHIGNLGLVKRKYVGSVVKFYGYVKFINSLQKTQAKDLELHGNNSESFDRVYEASLKRLVDDFETEFNAAFEKYSLPKFLKAKTDPQGGIDSRGFPVKAQQNPGHSVS